MVSQRARSMHGKAVPGHVECLGLTLWLRCARYDLLYRRPRSKMTPLKMLDTRLSGGANSLPFRCQRDAVHVCIKSPAPTDDELRFHQLLMRRHQHYNPRRLSGSCSILVCRFVAVVVMGRRRVELRFGSRLILLGRTCIRPRLRTSRPSSVCPGVVCL